MTFFRYHQTGCFFLPARGGKFLAFDAGWPCTLYEYRRLMKTVGLAFEDLAWAVASHMHLDHAGLLGEFQRASIECFVLDGPEDGIEAMEKIILRNPEYRDYAKIRHDDLTRTSVGEFNLRCRTLGILGQLVSTPGHSPDSVSFLTNDGQALIGDLPPPDQVMDDDTASLASWERLRSLGAKTIFPSHAQGFSLRSEET